MKRSKAEVVKLLDLLDFSDINTYNRPHSRGDNMFDSIHPSVCLSVLDCETYVTRVLIFICLFMGG